MKKSTLTRKILMFSLSLLLALFNVLTPLNSASSFTNKAKLKESPVNQKFINAQSNKSMSIGGKKQANSKQSLGYAQAPFKLPIVKSTTYNKQTSFPTTYDLRKTGKLTSIKDQLSSGSCWAFASLASIESNLLSEEKRDFSENNLKNNSGFDLHPNNDGGNLFMATAYTARGLGPVNETDDPFDPNSIKSPTGLAVQKHVEDVLWIPDRTNFLDNNAIKDAVMKYGAVFTSMYWEDSSYNVDYSTSYNYFDGNYYYGNNHAVNIVGWDDNFDKNKFYDSYYGINPPANGAFIVRNSWGNSFGEDGYFYVSYYDKNIGASNGVFDVIKPTTNYSTNYQYDPLGLVQSIGDDTDTAWYSNVFTASSTEGLSAVAFYTLVPNSIYEVYVSSNYKSTSDLAYSRVLKASGTMSMAGYHTINFNAITQVTKGEKFAVIVKVKTPNYFYPIPVESNLEGYSSGATAAAGQSYVSSSGSEWYDLTTVYNSTANVCLKAFTKPIAPNVNYTVTFNSQGGSAVTSKTVAGGSIIAAPIAPTKTGYTFGGWYKEVGCLNAWNFTTDKVIANTTLYAKWTINKYKVTFNSQGGSAVTGKTVNYNNTITAPTAPTKTGYTFEGWYKEAGCLNAWNFTTNKVTANTTLYAKWANPIITAIRYAGQDRFETAVQVSKAGWVTSQNVVLVNAYGFADALTGVPFAYLKDAPILLTGPNAIPKSTSDEIKRLGAKNIYILGGTGVVSTKLANDLKNNGFNVFRLAGTDRFETAIKIGNEVLKDNLSKTAVLTTAYNYPDALAISSYAAMNKYPILYTQGNTLNVKSKEFLKNKGITKIIIPGGIGVVSENVAKQLKESGITVERISGADRYSTALNIVTKYKSSFKKEIIIATGSDFPDALAGGVLAAKRQIPILLVGKDVINNEVKSYIKLNVVGNMYILGGTGVVSEKVVKLIVEP